MNPSRLTRLDPGMATLCISSKKALSISERSLEDIVGLKWERRV